MLVLKVVVQPQPLGGEIFADHAHPQVAAALAAELGQQREAQMPGLVRPPLRLAQQRLPFVARQAAVLEIGARPFAAVVEEADIVVRLLQRLDFRLDEGIQLGEIVDQFRGQREIHLILSEQSLELYAI